MLPPTQDEDERNAAEQGDEGSASGEGQKGKTGSGSAGGAKFSQEDIDAREKETDKGEGDQDSFGRGKAGAASGMATASLSEKQKQQVRTERRHLLGAELVEAIVEFFNELPMRASANAVVEFVKDGAKNVNAKSFAIVNWVIEFGTKASRDFARNRERDRGAGRDSRGLQSQKPKTKGFGINPGPAGPNQ